MTIEEVFAKNESERGDLENMNDIVAIVPIKEHSERVPNKNIRLFNGKPLFFWIIQELLYAKHVRYICVDTDSHAIIDAIKKLFEDITFILRPLQLRGDEVSMNSIINYDINEELDAENYIQTHTTNPLLTRETIDSAIETYFSNLPHYDSLFTVSRIQTRCYAQDGACINHDPENLIPTQNLPPVYVENSNMYIFSRDSFNIRKRRIGKRPYMFEMNAYEALDIDEEEDFICAEILHKARKKEC